MRRIAGRDTFAGGWEGRGVRVFGSVQLLDRGDPKRDASPLVPSRSSPADLSNGPVEGLALPMTVRTPRWEPAPGPSSLDRRLVHVFRALVSREPARSRELPALLTAEELSRADRFVREEDRRRFISARALLRRTVGRYVGREPADLRFVQGEHGKPRLDPAEGGGGVCFNVSHSGDLVLLALSRDREVGVDVERVRPENREDDLVERYFAAGEAASYRDLPPERRHHAFFTCWTRKEAFIKATGKGLSLGLGSFEVPVRPDEPAALRWTEDPAQRSRWAIRDLDPAPGYVGAVAAEGREWRLRCWDVSDPDGPER